jgi:flagellar protein FlbD
MKCLFYSVLSFLRLFLLLSLDTRRSLPDNPQVCSSADDSLYCLLKGRDGRTVTLIMLTRLNGEQFALNPDLIERAEESPDTVLTLVDGKHLMVKEKLTDLIEAIRMDRASILALAQEVAASVDLQDGKQGPNVVPLNPRR